MDIGRQSVKQLRSLILKIGASNAQFPSAGFALPGINLRPCLPALAIALCTIKLWPSPRKNDGIPSGTEDDNFLLIGEDGGLPIIAGGLFFFLLLVLGIVCSSTPEGGEEGEEGDKGEKWQEREIQNQFFIGNIICRRQTLFNKMIIN